MDEFPGMYKRLAKGRIQGFSLIEIVIALFFLAVAMVGILLLISSAHRSSMDTYYGFMARQLAREPLEVFRTFGYVALKKMPVTPIPEYELNIWKTLEQMSPAYGMERPSGAVMFERRIETREIREQELKGFLITVRVRPATLSAAQKFMRKEETVCSTVVLAQNP
jgi:Tfp pilus assembly protein PilV